MQSWHGGQTDLAVANALIGTGPTDAISAPIAPESQQGIHLALIERLDRVVQSLLWLDIGSRGQGIVDPTRPAFLVKNVHNK